MNWSEIFVMVYTNVTNQTATLYVSVVNLSTQDNEKLLQQLKSGFKMMINWNKYPSKPELLAQNPNSNHLVESSFQVVIYFLF